MTPARLPVCLAAGNPVTAEVGADILHHGGSAADSAVAMVLASCVAETVFTGLGGGGYATYYDAATRSVHCLDFFAAVPGLGGLRRVAATEIAIDFGGQLVPYAVGAATVAVPGVPAGAAELHRRWGRLTWPELVAPAVAHATRGVSFAPLHSQVLAKVAPAMLIGEGGTIYARDGHLLAGGARLFHPGLDTALRTLSDEGAESFYTGRIAEAMVAVVGDQGDLGSEDLARYQVVESQPRVAELGDVRLFARGDDLDDLLSTVSSLDLPDDEAGRAVELVRALRAAPRRGDTTSIAVADRDGNACAVTTSLGLSSGIWLPALGIHLNSMMGEGELLRGDEVPGRRMGSMMSPLVAMDDGDEPVLVAGAAGGSRIRSSLLQVLVNVFRGGMSAHDAIWAPRLNPVPGRVHLEPGFSAEVRSRLSVDDEVVVWPTRDSYFGGVAAVGLSGPGADPRRGGDVRRVHAAVS